jgi:hypothetical protein
MEIAIRHCGEGDASSTDWRSKQILAHKTWGMGSWALGIGNAVKLLPSQYRLECSLTDFSLFLPTN